MVAQDLDGVRVATAGGRQQVGGSWRHGATGVGGRPHERPDRVGVVQHAELVPLAPLEVGDGPVAVADGGQPGQRHDQRPPVGDVLLQCRGQLGQVGPGRQLELVDGEDEPRPPAHRHLHGGGQHALEDQVGSRRRRVGARDGDFGPGAQDRRSRRHPLHPKPPASGCARHELSSGFEPFEQLSEEARAGADLDAHREPAVELRRDRGDLAQQDGLSHSSGTHQHQRPRGATVERGHLQRLADCGQRLVPARQHPGRLVEAWAVGVGLPIHPFRLAGSSTSSEEIDL